MAWAEHEKIIIKILDNYRVGLMTTLYVTAV